MTTIDLLQRYSPHNDHIHDRDTSHKTKILDCKKPDPTILNENPSQYFDAKTKVLHEMLDRVVKDLANTQSEPASEWEGTLWRSPLLPRSRSPTYSEISDSFDSPSRIEHCTNDLLSSPMSPSSTQFKGPDGWPLGIEVAINDFHRGRLSTPILREEDLPNRLILRKQQQQTPRFGGNGQQEGQGSASCKTLLFEQAYDDQQQQEVVGVEPLAFQKQQSSVCFQQHGKRRDRVDSASLEPLASQSQQQAFTLPQQQSDCSYQRENRENVDHHINESQQQHDEETGSDVLCVSTLTARRYGDDLSSLWNAFTDLDPAVANGNLPIGLGLDKAGLELSICHPYAEESNRPHVRTNASCLLHKDSRQTTPSIILPHDLENYENAHIEETEFNAAIDSSKALIALETFGVESADREKHQTGGQNTSEAIGLDTFQAIAPLTPDDSDSDTDGDVLSWKNLGLLEDILEEEDILTGTFPLDQPQHFPLRSIQPLDDLKSSGAGEAHDTVLPFQRPLTKTSTLCLSPPRLLPTSNLSINSYSRVQFESTRSLRHRPIDAKPSESIPLAATMVEMKDRTRKEGRLTAAALAELRKTAECQPHFQIGPDSSEDQTQAGIHPLMRSKSFSRPSLRPTDSGQDATMKHLFQDDDKHCHETEEMGSVSHQINMKPCVMIQPEAQDESSVTLTRMKAHTSWQLDKMMEETVPKYLCKEHETGAQEAEHAGTFTPQGSTLRSSNDTTLVPSLENPTPPSGPQPSTSSLTKNCRSVAVVGFPEEMPTNTFQLSSSPATTAYCLHTAIGSSAAFNSWASTPHRHEHGNSCSTPSSRPTLPTSTFPTPNTPFHDSAATSRTMIMTPSPSLGQITGTLPNSREIPMTPSSSFVDFAQNNSYRRSVSFSSMFARYHKARYPDLPTAATADSILSSNESAKNHRARDATNDPFTSTRDSTTPSTWNLKPPSKEDSADTPNVGLDKFNTPTKRSSGRFSLHRRSLSISGRPSINEGLDRALSTLLFNPRRARLHKRNNSTTSASISTTAQSDGSGLRRSLSIATNTVEQKWEIAPPSTPLDLRDEFSMRYRPEPLQADDHYASRKAALQGMKQGLKKVFGRQ